MQLELLGISMNEEEITAVDVEFLEDIIHVNEILTKVTENDCAVINDLKRRNDCKY